jgi:hypothetical protein
MAGRNHTTIIFLRGTLHAREDRIREVWEKLLGREKYEWQN